MREAGEEVVLLYGARRAEELAGKELFEGLGVRVRTIVEEGPGERTGLVTELLEELLGEEGTDGVRAYSCGPTPMLRAVGERLLEAGVPHQTSLEEYMACGFGVCLGCAVPVRAGDGFTYERCCVEGPVFDYAALAW
jgi:dihydroorotate dehydrogenase electron transfer subunit